MAKIPLEFVEQLMEELVQSIESMGDFEAQTIDEGYRFACAGHILDAAKGYVILKSVEEDKGAFHLVRPAYEILLKLAAIRQKPIVLYWLFLSETDQEQRWSKANHPTGYDSTTEAVFVKRRADFEQLYQSQYPQHVLTPVPGNRLSIRDIAKHANMEPTYNAHYNVLSSVSHGAVRGMLSDRTHIIDGNLVMATALYEAFRALEIIGHPSPNQPALEQEFRRLNALP